MVGAVLGLAAGVGLGLAYHDGRPVEWVAVARLLVNGPGADPVAAEAELVRSPQVLEPAARLLDAQGPFDAAPPAGTPERVAFLRDHLRADREDGELVLRLRTPTADAPKYLRAVVHAHREVDAARQAANPWRVPTEKALPAPPPEPSEYDKLVAEQARLEVELAKLVASAETAADRLPAARADLDRVRRQLVDLDAVTPAKELPAPPANPSLERELKAARAKRAELGERLGPDHREMVALADDIRQLEATLAPPNKPQPTDDRDRREADRAALAAQAGVLTAAVARDEAAAKAAGPVRAELEKVKAARAEAEKPKTVTQTLTPNEGGRGVRPPPEFKVNVATVTAPPLDAAIIAPPVYESLVPGGLLGLLLGGGLGWLAGRLVPTGDRPPREPQPGPTVVGPVRVPAAVAAVTAEPEAARPVEPAPPRRPSKTTTLVPILPATDRDLGMPLLARVPHIDPKAPAERRSGEGLDPTLVAFFRPTSAEAEAFKAARRGLAGAVGKPGHVVLLVTGPGPGDGASTAAANLAVSLAQSGKRVILVDADLRSPRVQGLFNLTRLGDGLRSVMTADVDLRMAVRSCEVGNLFLLPAGRGPMDPVDLLTRPKFRELMADLKAGYEYVIVDAPPATAGQELAALAEYADGTLLAVRGGTDAGRRAGWAREQLAAVGARPTAAILTAAPAGGDPVTGEPAAVPAPRTPEQQPTA